MFHCLTTVISTTSCNWPKLCTFKVNVSRNFLPFAFGFGSSFFQATWNVSWWKTVKQIRFTETSQIYELVLRSYLPNTVLRITFAIFAFKKYGSYETHLCRGGYYALRLSIISVMLNNWLLLFVTKFHWLFAVDFGFLKLFIEWNQKQKQRTCEWFCCHCHYVYNMKIIFHPQSKK